MKPASSVAAAPQGFLTRISRKALFSSRVGPCFDSEKGSSSQDLDQHDMTTTGKYLPVPERDLLELAATVAERQWTQNEQAAPDTDDIDSKELAS